MPGNRSLLLLFLLQSMFVILVVVAVGHQFFSLVVVLPFVCCHVFIKRGWLFYPSTAFQLGVLVYVVIVILLCVLYHFCLSLSLSVESLLFMPLCPCCSILLVWFCLANNNNNQNQERINSIGTLQRRPAIRIVLASHLKPIAKKEEITTIPSSIDQQ